MGCHILKCLIIQILLLKSPDVDAASGLFFIFTMINTAITHDITVLAQNQYLPEGTHPAIGEFGFAYCITIENGGAYTVQLLRRHWFITDGSGFLREIEGEGVLGLQPILAPGQVHSYTSWCSLKTDIGKMRGTFQMLRQADGVLFDIAVPEFQLMAPFKGN